MGKIRSSGRQSNVLTYLTSNADRPITLKELSKETDCPEGAASSAISRLILDFPTQLERSARGVYIWHSTPTMAKKVSATEGNLMLVKIMKYDENVRRWLIMDENDTLYVMKEVEW